MKQLINYINEGIATIGGFLRVGEYIVTIDKAIRSTDGNILNYDQMSISTLLTLIEVITLEQVNQTTK